jgi:hypothetical protein
MTETLKELADVLDDEAFASYDVLVGNPSWHQARAGHNCASIMSFSTRSAAEQYARNIHAQGEYVRIVRKVNP